jgi:hypothetical protein
MDRMEEQLKRALERRDPSPDFSARVMARITEQKGALPWWRAWLAPTPTWRTATAGALAVLLLSGAGVGYYEYEQRQRALAARDQLLQALQITSTHLNRVSRMVHQQ